MDFDDAIVSHLKWKIHLRNFIDGRGKDLDIDTVGQEESCELGRWIQDEGKKFAHSPTFQELVAKHVQFHRTAAEIVNKVVAGDKTGAEELLSTGREFSSVSRDIVAAIMRLEEEVSGKRR
ncbi:MAG: CZB domain-containing protein [Sulfuricellaceae bacterium]|jgi:methyl-accepting chemotaxis protein